MTSFLLWIAQAQAEPAGQTFWLPKQASTLAEQTDTTFYFIYWISIVFFIILMGAMLLFAVQYKKKSDADKTLDIKGSHKLEFVWSVFPSFLLIAMFVMGFKTYVYSVVPPADSLEVLVKAKKWDWSYTYAEYGIEIGSADALVVPKGKAVRLRMVSDDVIHSFYVPDFRTKKDVVPNRYTMLWFEANDLYEGRAYMKEAEKPTGANQKSNLFIRGCAANTDDCMDGHAKGIVEATTKYAAKKGIKIDGEIKAGVHQVFCTEYCGDNHSRMLSKIVVLEPEHFDIWMKSQMDFSPWEAYVGADGKPDKVKVGKFLAGKNGCNGCHSVDGTGTENFPSWKGLIGSDRNVLVGGKPQTVKADFAYIQESILNPNAKIVAQYQGKQMNNFNLKTNEVEAIYAYMESLK